MTELEISAIINHERQLSSLFDQTTQVVAPSVPFEINRFFNHFSIECEELLDFT